MNSRLYVCLVALALQACSSERSECDSPAFEAKSAALEASVGAPYADEYFTVWRTSLNSCEKKAQRAQFIQSFFDGYRARHTGMEDAPAAFRVMVAGIRAGERYRLANPNSEVATYASFGYAAVSVKGSWTTGFESSRFVPAEGYEGEKWWLELFPELANRLPDNLVPKEGLTVQITGYVSGLGEHGHLGAYQRQMYVRDMNVLGDRPER